MTGKLVDTSDPRGALLQIVDGWATLPWPGDGQIGVPYVYDGKDPRTGLDCSGCVTAALEAVGLAPAGWGLDHNAQSLFDLFDPISPLAGPQPGDIAFYGRDTAHVDHVMIVASDGRVVGASGAGATCNSPQIARSLGACVHYRPSVTYRPDLLGFRLLPTGGVAAITKESA